jgi:hypothetical protein
MDYQAFLTRKSQLGETTGFEPTFMPEMLFDFQRMLVEWATRKGRAAIFADCGLGKTFVQLAWAEGIARKTNGRILILTPLAVAPQTVREGEKIGVEVTHRREGLRPNDRIVVTNYERLHYFQPDDFVAIVCDESSILKNFDGETRKAITEFMRKRPYRLLCTATAAPNDYIELGTSSEALGAMGNQDMLNRFFRREKSFVKLCNAGGQGWEMRPHARRDFWRWVVSWARALRSPSDLGCSDAGFLLPALIVNEHIVQSSMPRPGYLFDTPTIGLAEQRADLRHTLAERCEKAAQLINAHVRPAIAWCNLNDEGKLLAKLITGAVEVCGNDSEERKEEVFNGFVNGDIRVLVTKPTIGGFGLNFQHCAHQTFFPSHSYEQWYQAIRRCWRFGQRSPVTVDMITTDGQKNVVSNLQTKANKASEMFEHLVTLTHDALYVSKRSSALTTIEVPKWLSSIKC